MYRDIDQDSHLSKWRDAERELAIRGFLVQPLMRVDTPRYIPPLSNPKVIEPIGGIEPRTTKRDTLA